MRNVNRLVTMAGVSFALCFGAMDLAAQNGGGAPQGRQRGGGGNFDPAQMQQRMMDRYKEQLEVKDDAEWKIIQTRIEKVTEARRQVGSGMGRGMFGRPGGPGGAPGAPGADNAQAAQGQTQRRGFGGEPNPDAEALQKAIDSKASSAELKAALEKYQASRKTKQAELEKAQAGLRSVLTPRQEAICTLNGLL